MNYKLKVIGLALVIVASLFLLFRRSAPTTGMPFVDVDARQIVLVPVSEEYAVPGAVEFPLQSPVSGEKSLYPGYECGDCGTIVVFTPRIDDRGLAHVPRACPLCDGDLRGLELEPGERRRQLSEETSIVIY